MSVLVAYPKNQPTKLLLKPVSGDIIATELQFVELLLWLCFLILEAAPCLVLLLLYYSWIGNQKISWDVAHWYPEMLHKHRRAKTCSFKLTFKRKSHNLFFLSYIWLVKSAVVAIVEWPIVSPPSQPRNYFFMSPSQTNKSAQWIGGILRPELMRLKTCSPETKKGKYQ